MVGVGLRGGAFLPSADREPFCESGAPRFVDRACVPQNREAQLAQIGAGATVQNFVVPLMGTEAGGVGAEDQGALEEESRDCQ